MSIRIIFESRSNFVPTEFSAKLFAMSAFHGQTAKNAGHIEMKRTGSNCQFDSDHNMDFFIRIKGKERKSIRTLLILPLKHKLF